MRTHIFTSATANYIPKARVLAHSVKRYHPQCCFHLVFPDTVPRGFRLEEEPFDSLLTIADLGLTNPEQWMFKHSLVELSTAVKGPALLKLLGLADCSEAVYLDPDIVVLAPLDELLDQFRAASILLTPHLTEPETALEGIRDHEICTLQHGIYNLGFVGVKNSPEGRRFASWWADRLREFCYDDIPQGLFTDQRWADLAPAYFPECRILRDPVYNVCTWNLSHRRVEGTLQAGLTVGGRRIAFYHFSGFDSGSQKAMLEKYGRGVRGLSQLRQWYITECDRMGQREFAAIPWRYDYFANGEPISSQQRRLYRERTDLQQAFPNPYATADLNHSYCHWFQANYERETRMRSGVEEARERIAEDGCGWPLTRQGRRESAARPEYDIVLSAAGADGESAVAAAQEILRQSYQQSRLVVMGPEEVLREVAANPELAGRCSRVVLTEGSDHDQAFAEACARCRDRDFLFVQATTLPSEYCDVRLAWSAASQQGIATVSPICDRERCTALDYAGEFTRSGDPVEEIAQVDRMCHSMSELLLPEIPRFLEECVYVRAEAAQDARILAEASGLSSVGGFRGFLELTSQLRYSHMLADHVYVGTTEPLPPERTPSTRPDSIPPALVRLSDAVRTRLGDRNRQPLSTIRSRTMPRHLHVMHSWGGGLERWVQEYCRADGAHQNLVLKSVGTWGAFGQELHLFRHIDDTTPAQVWPLYPAIKGTTTTHPGYEQVLQEILDDYGIERILVSSLVGHSLEALRAEPASLFVCHDFYPYCPALNVTFRTLCERCSHEDLVHCSSSNPLHRFFRNLPPSYWRRIRREFVDRITTNRVTMVAPTPSVVEDYVRLAPELRGCFWVVPHGTRPVTAAPLKLNPESAGPLRVVVLGSLAPQKGQDLFREIKDELLQFARVYLVGCGSDGDEFEGEGVTVIRSYRWSELAGILEEIGPDLGLLLSVVPETFSYSLQELFELGIPPVVTRIGSLGDRVQDGQNGFLCRPEGENILKTLHHLHENRRLLAQVHESLCRQPTRSIEAMLGDYGQILASSAPSMSAYFSRKARIAEPAPFISSLQLFWRAEGECFEESRSTVRRVHSAGPHHLRLAIPESSCPPVELRLDLGSDVGVVRVGKIALRAGSDQPVWDWGTDPQIWAASKRSQTLVLGGGSQEGVLLCVTGDDPQVYLPVPESISEQIKSGAELELDVAWPSLQETVAILVDAAAQREGYQMPGADWRQLLSQFGLEPGPAPVAVQREGIVRQLGELQQVLDDLRGSWSWRLTAPVRTVGAMALKLRRHKP